MLLQSAGAFAIGELLIVLTMAMLIRRLKSSTHETRLLYFAAVILTTLALIFLLSMAMFYWSPTNGGTAGREIFDRCTQVIPPIVTLVLGYFFGRQEADKGSDSGGRPPVEVPNEDPR
jgi:hypothetical protein